MFKAAKELRSSLIRNSLKSFVVSPFIKKFQVRAVRAICLGNLTKENIWLQRKKMEKVLEDNEHIACFFSCITAMVERRIQKQGGGEMIREAVRKMENNLLTHIIPL